MLTVAVKVLPDRTLVRPLARSVLRLNRLEDGRLKSETEGCETTEVEDSGRSGPEDPGRSFDSAPVVDTAAAGGSFS